LKNNVFILFLPFICKAKWAVGIITKGIDITVTFNVTHVLLAVALVLVAFNQLTILSINSALGASSAPATIGVVAAVSAAERSTQDAQIKSSDNSITPTGVPEIYGEELGVSFDDVTPEDQQRADATIRKMGILDQQIKLEGDDLKRYINILFNLHDGISCEYCCGATSVIFSDGRPACGCAHSYAMRGLAKYLITNHGDEYTDEQILEEVGKWKTLFFPTQIAQKADALRENGIEVNYISLTSNQYRGIEKEVSGGMVGGC
jgi:hypothetical protein